MAWPKDIAAGFALATTLLDDLRARRAVGALAEQPRRSVDALLDAISASKPGPRAAMLRHVASKLKTRPQDAGSLPPRVWRAIENGRLSLRGAHNMTPQRRGLAHTVARLASSNAASNLDCAREEIERGQRLARAVLPHASMHHRECLTKALEAKTIGPLESPDKPEPHSHHERTLALISVARRLASDDVLRVLGALDLGWSGDLAGDHLSTPWRHVGRDLAALWGDS
jgi:hypothetical protein